MADGDGGILAHEHHGSGLAHHQAAADDNGILALAVDAVVVQDLHAGGGGAGGIAQVQALEHTGIGHMGHAVHILFGVKPVADLVLVRLQVLGQWPEHEHAVDGIVGVDLIDDGQDILLGSVLGQLELLDLHAHQLGPLHSALFIAQVAGVGAHTDDAQGGDGALFAQDGGTGLQGCIQCIGNFFAK